MGSFPSTLDLEKTPIFREICVDLSLVYCIHYFLLWWLISDKKHLVGGRMHFVYMSKGKRGGTRVR